MSLDALHRRLHGVRFRVSEQRSRYRQRHHAAGTWQRLQRLLALSSRVWLLDAREADELEQEGFGPDPVGAELEPPKRIFVLPPSRAARLERAREAEVRLGADLLEAPAWALEPFDLGRGG